MWWWALLWGCTGAEPEGITTEGPSAEAPWSRELPSSDLLGERRGRPWKRSVIHLHSPFSHDACDGEGYVEGVFNEGCLEDLRAGLCATRHDFAFITDHPAFAAEQEWDDWLMVRDGDELVVEGGATIGNRILCDDGHVVTTLPGIEDELMPIGLERHVEGDAAERDATYNRYDAETVGRLIAAGGDVFVAHTEQRKLDDLEGLREGGLVGVEVFNLHAAFAPDIRSEFLGWDGYSWLSDIEPFTTGSGGAEPDLFFLAVLAEESPSVGLWDDLLATGPVTGIAGTDAHQNTLSALLGDGERGDSYRRMLRWFSNQALVDGESVGEMTEALAAGRNAVVFEALGTLEGLDLTLEPDDGQIVEMGGEGGPGTLDVGCPSLLAGSPRGMEDPEITVTVYKNGEEFATGCGEHPVGPGVYRVRVDVVPHHLRPFFGDDPEPWMRPFPWAYLNAIRVR